MVIPWSASLMNAVADAPGVAVERTHIVYYIVLEHMRRVSLRTHRVEGRSYVACVGLPLRMSGTLYIMARCLETGRELHGNPGYGNRF